MLNFTLQIRFIGAGELPYRGVRKELHSIIYKMLARDWATYARRSRTFPKDSGDLARSAFVKSTGSLQYDIGFSAPYGIFVPKAREWLFGNPKKRQGRPGRNVRRWINRRVKKAITMLIARLRTKKPDFTLPKWRIHIPPG